MENSGSVYATVCDVDLSAHCDSYSSNYPTNITQTLTYAIIDEITGDLVSSTHFLFGFTAYTNDYVLILFIASRTTLSSQYQLLSYWICV